MNKTIRKICIFLSISLFVSLFGILPVKAENQLPKDVTIVVDNGEARLVHGLHVYYDNNLYVSLVDMQNLLKGTPKEFDFSISEGVINIITRDIVEMTERDREISGWSEDAIVAYESKSAAMNTMYVDEVEKKYNTVLTTLGGYKDCFIHISDLCMILDLNALMENGYISINTSENMKAVNPKQLEDIGFFQSVNSILVGDATTGEIFYEYKGDEVFPIASTTKLMTYLLMEEAVQSGRISYDDLVPVSKTAVELSKSSDGLIPLTEGQMIPLRELIYAALIISSNECDHLVSESFGGDEETIVAMMNEKAAQLNMTSAEFYNCNGLPIYANDLVSAKKQNRMTSRDMFTLASYILNTYPQVKDITSTQYAHMDVLNKDLKNTNPLLFNMPEASGLKTGTTNRSGACLVASITVNDGSMDHDIVVVELGAETSADRGRITELMARYGKAVLLKQASAYEHSVEPQDEDTLSANGIIKMIVNKAMLNVGK